MKPSQAHAAIRGSVSPWHWETGWNTSKAGGTSWSLRTLPTQDILNHKKAAESQHQNQWGDLPEKKVYLWDAAIIKENRFFYHALSRQLRSSDLHTHKCILRYPLPPGLGSTALQRFLLVSSYTYHWIWASYFLFSTPLGLRPCSAHSAVWRLRHRWPLCSSNPPWKRQVKLRDSNTSSEVWAPRSSN